MKTAALLCLAFLISGIALAQAGTKPAKMVEITWSGVLEGTTEIVITPETNEVNVGKLSGPIPKKYWLIEDIRPGKNLSGNKAIGLMFTNERKILIQNVSPAKAGEPSDLVLVYDPAKFE